MNTVTQSTQGGIRPWMFFVGMAMIAASIFLTSGIQFSDGRSAEEIAYREAEMNALLASSLEKQRRAEAGLPQIPLEEVTLADAREAGYIQ